MTIAETCHHQTPLVALTNLERKGRVVRSPAELGDEGSVTPDQWHQHLSLTIHYFKQEDSLMLALGPMPDFVVSRRGSRAVLVVMFALPFFFSTRIDGVASSARAHANERARHTHRWRS